MIDLKQIRARLEAANSQPLSISRRFIAAAPTDIAELLDALENCKIALEKLRDGPGKMEGWKATWAHKFAGDWIKEVFGE